MKSNTTITQTSALQLCMIKTNINNTNKCKTNCVCLTPRLNFEIDRSRITNALCPSPRRSEIERACERVWDRYYFIFSMHTLNFSRHNFYTFYSPKQRFNHNGNERFYCCCLNLRLWVYYKKKFILEYFSTTQLLVTLQLFNIDSLYVTTTTIVYLCVAGWFYIFRLH